MNAQFQVLTVDRDILDAVRNRLRSHSTEKVPKSSNSATAYFDAKVPFGSPAHLRLWGGSTCYLRVPIDLKPSLSPSEP